MVFGVGGVREVNPILGTRSAIKVDDKEVPVILVGYDSTTGVGGPWKIAEGSSKPASGQFVIDKTFAKLYDFSVGNSIEIMDRKFAVSGLSDGTNVWYAQYTFLNMADLADLMQLKGLASYLLVTASDHSRAGAVAAEISREAREVT